MNLICGINPVLEALASGTRHFDRLLVVKGLRSRRLSDAIGRATRLGIPLRFEMRDTLDRLAGGVPHQGLIAIVSAKPLLSLEELLEASRSPALLVALDGVEDPRNLGAILRTVEAAGADGALLPERHSAGLSETVDRTSAGALEHVQVAQVGNLVHALETLKERGVWIVGLDAGGQERWDGVDLTQSVCLVLGGEGKGIRRLVREHCDHLVSIPQFGHVGSLNVSVAAGIALYEAVRQRGTVPSPLRPIPSRPPVEPRVIGPHPDDEESDPGAAPPIPADALSEGEDPEGEASPLPHVDIHGEEVAWGQGPIVLKPVGFERGRRTRQGRRKGVRRRTAAKATPTPAQKSATKAARKAAQETPRAPEEQQPAASGEAKPSRKGRRRRRRKKAAGPRGKTASKGANASSGASASPVPEGSAKSERATRRRRRPRRRRPQGSG
jgi:23S rRNA (guanosine2251-2'-O)-methyltransferase